MLFYLSFLVGAAPLVFASASASATYVGLNWYAVLAVFVGVMKFVMAAMAVDGPLKDISDALCKARILTSARAAVFFVMIAIACGAGYIGFNAREGWPLAAFGVYALAALMGGLDVGVIAAHRRAMATALGSLT